MPHILVHMPQPIRQTRLNGVVVRLRFGVQDAACFVGYLVDIQYDEVVGRYQRNCMVMGDLVVAFRSFDNSFCSLNLRR